MCEWAGAGERGTGGGGVEEGPGGGTSGGMRYAGGHSRLREIQLKYFCILASWSIPLKKNTGV
jgi:hypothetical protein